MYVTDVIDESYRVAWADLCFMKENMLETLLTSLVGPLLYLLAFGYGIGGSMGGGQAYVVFIIPGIIALNTLSSTFSTVSMRVFVQKRFYFSFDEMLLCPIHVSSVVIGKSLYGVARALISCTILLIVGKLIAPEVAITPWIFVIILASSFTFSLIGLLVGMKVKKTNSVSLISGTLIVPMTFLCGTLFDVSALPAWAGAAVYALPLTHVSALTRAVSLGGGIPLDSVAILMVYMAVFFFVCWYLIKTNRC
ncbi:MAG: ABC transporter permease [Candidatus Methanomethylophilaceae archaeon]|nr:ABC transporter permease [Candidatus Methanomethylophilaceae archaeon]